MVDFSNILNTLKTNIITIFVLISIIYSDSQIQKDTLNNLKTILGISILTIFFWFKGTLLKYDLNFMLVLYGLYVITIYGYTFYQWEKSSLKTDKDCSFSIPRTKKFNDIKYYFYRIIYLTTVIVIITLIQSKLDKGGISSDKTSDKWWYPSPQNFIVILPILLPFLTEFVNEIVDAWDNRNDDKNSINPESLLSSFMLGDTKKSVFTPRILLPLALYIVIIYISYSKNENSLMPISLLLIFVIGFSFWMRYTFVQDCSIAKKKDISKTKEFELFCAFEKYGGIQALIATCFLVSMLSYIKNTTFKLFIFIIIGLASGLLSSVFIINLKS